MTAGVQWGPRHYATLLVGYETRSAALHFVTSEGSWCYRWWGFTLRNWFVGVMRRYPKPRGVLAGTEEARA